MKIKKLLKNRPKQQQTRRSLLDVSTGEEEILQATRQASIDPFERFVAESIFSEDQRKTTRHTASAHSGKNNASCGFERRDDDDSATFGGIGVAFEKFGGSLGENITNFSCASNEQAQCMNFSNSKVKKGNGDGNGGGRKGGVSSLTVSTSGGGKQQGRSSGRSETNIISPTSILDVHGINAHLSAAQKTKSSEISKPSSKIDLEDERRDDLSKLASLKALVEKEKSRIDLQLREGNHHTDCESRSAVAVDGDKYMLQETIGSDCDTPTRKNGLNALNRFSLRDDALAAAKMSGGKVETSTTKSKEEIAMQRNKEAKPHLSPQIKSSSIPISSGESSVNLSCASSVNVEETKKVLFPTIDDASTVSFTSIPTSDRAKVKISVTSNVKDEAPKTGLRNDTPLLEQLRPEELLGSLYTPIFSFLEKYFETGCQAQTAELLISPEAKDQGVEVTLSDFSAKDETEQFVTNKSSNRKKRRGKKKERKYEPLKLNLSVVLEESRLVSDTSSDDASMAETLLSPPRVNRHIRDLSSASENQAPIVANTRGEASSTLSSKNSTVEDDDSGEPETAHIALNNSWVGAEDRFKIVTKPVATDGSNWIGGLIESPEKEKPEATKVTVELRVEGNEDRHGDTEVNVSIESISSDGPWLDGKEEAFQFANDPILQLSIDSNSSCEGKEESCLNVSITGIIQMNSNQSNALLDQMQQEEEESTREIYSLNAEETNDLLGMIAREANIASNTDSIAENGGLDSSTCSDIVVENLASSVDVSIYSSGSEVEIIPSPHKSMDNLESFPEVGAINLEHSQDDVIVREESFCDEEFPTSSACRGEESWKDQKKPIFHIQESRVLERQGKNSVVMKPVTTADGSVSSVRSLAMAFETTSRPKITKMELQRKDKSDGINYSKDVDDARSEKEDNRSFKEESVVKGRHQPSNLRATSKNDDCAGSVRSIAKAFEASSKSETESEDATNKDTCNQSVASNSVYLHDKGSDEISCCSSLTMSTVAPPSSVTSYSKAPSSTNNYGRLSSGRARASSGIAARIAAFERASASEASV